MKEKKHKIVAVEPDSIAAQLEIKPGDYLIQMNGKEIVDVFDYHYLMNDEQIVVLIQKENGEEWEYEIEKEVQEDLGIRFEESLMDQYQSCRNQCIFCFIDQMPKGMRETLYFKDDDARLSFLQGNYITLTNMSEADIERIIWYKLAPINISVHTTNPELRCRMLHNRFAGQVLEKIERLYQAKLEMNSQVVLCKGYNDGEELERTIQDLSHFLPYMKSLSVVPVGLTKYRESLIHLEKFSREEAKTVLNTIHKWQKKLLKERGTRFVHASDEWYLKAGMPIPEEDSYEGYGQLENGVGMVRSLTNEVEQELQLRKGDSRIRTLSLATGVLAAPIICGICEKLRKWYPNIHTMVYPIENNFFGTDITVAGLLTGKDMIEQLTGKNLGEQLLLPSVLLRSGEDVLLDNITIPELQKALQIPIHIVQSDGKSLIDALLGTLE